VNASDLIPAQPHFRTQEETLPLIREACAERDDVATFHELGESEEGRPLAGVVLGDGPRRVSLIAGNHADEPAGPETLRALLTNGLRPDSPLRGLLEGFRFVVVPHTNPDGEARNQPWIREWPNVARFVQHAQREEPGRDMEFGFPDLRRENELVADFLREHGPYDMHMSLHGMAFAEGAQLLIERRWAERTQPLRDAYAGVAQELGLGLHDHNRKGEKGFFYIEPGFATTPEGEAMRAHFRAQGDDDMVSCFLDSSMEFVRSLGTGDPLCLVTEVPLYRVQPHEDAPPGQPVAYQNLKERLPEVQVHLEEGRAEKAHALVEPFPIQPVSLRAAMVLHMVALAEGLKAVR
jgi:hypothetical protein